ncbi:hypothetical protein GQ55_4G119100 [Panicum hallii var. hallii]|uniref:Uncharacterized protein n=1 Tax=Panicum hallii var. hallii TaxID=1504633 RepID=A0A2T7DXQ8_9POAL|nr:hypothetical protein GQ55_4G119100 [Panicum hallii var. hallii]
MVREQGTAWSRGSTTRYGTVFWSMNRTMQPQFDPNNQTEVLCTRPGLQHSQAGPGSAIVYRLWALRLPYNVLNHATYHYKNSILDDEIYSFDDTTFMAFKQILK